MATYPRAQRAVHQNARGLQRVAFVQSERKPWQLMFQLPERRGVVFANFGSTEEIPIQEYPLNVDPRVTASLFGRWGGRSCEARASQLSRGGR